MALTAIFHFSVNRLWINADLRGTKHAIHIGEDLVCTIHLPEKPDDFGLANSPEPVAAIKGYVGTHGNDPRESPVAVQVHIVRVVVEGPGTADTAES